ncbi:uncharacterized protein N7483_003647 [Penicillium malachiteum]|uniref:uncharacterized protein n=1 Tax=Penicillium malachiteum TaxID=1324776 RepID=UPI002547932C|nr:uncharacterized protein N7483_003647 [Penicillium malachiteum]KAJ5729139.1 hypothetical protein N7483_003647 [Penicillium malachiteum]
MSRSPQPGPHEVLIKVIYCTSNPRDWKAPDHLILHKEIHQGNEMSGIVESICTEVYEFRAGDRVATGDPMQTANGTYYAEYAIAPVNTCFLLPPNISFAVHGQSTPFCDQKCEEDVDFAYALLRLVSKWLAEGR